MHNFINTSNAFISFLIMPAPYAGVWCLKMPILQPFPEDSFISPRRDFSSNNRHLLLT